MRYYFDLMHGHALISDEQGVEALDLEQALRQARSAILDLHRAGDLGDDSGVWYMIVRDAGGVIHRMIEVRPHPRDGLH